MSGEDSDTDWKSFIYSPYVADWTHSVRMHERLVDRPAITSNERLAFPHPSSLKRATLLADRIYMPCFANANVLEEVPLDLTFGNPKLDDEFYSKTWQYNEVDWPWKIEDPREKTEELLRIWLREPLTRYRTSFPEPSFIPINYAMDTPVLPAGKHDAYQGVLNNVPIAIETELTWDQILEFRKDEGATRKYRDLHLWLEAGLKAESERQATDVIAQKVEDYRWAIKKHGIRTVVEAMSSVISLGAIVPPAGQLAAHAMSLNPTLGTVAGGVLALMAGGAWVAKRCLDLQDIKRGSNREVAYIYELQQLPK